MEKKNLTPMGKFVIVKKHNVSLFNHLFIPLHNPPYIILISLKSFILIYNSDWHGKNKFTTKVKE